MFTAKLAKEKSAKSLEKIYNETLCEIYDKIEKATEQGLFETSVCVRGEIVNRIVKDLQKYEYGYEIDPTVLVNGQRFYGYDDGFNVVKISW